MESNMKSLFTEIGLNIRDFFQYSLPGVIAMFSILPIIFDFNSFDFATFLNYFNKINFWLFLAIFLFSYIIGQFIACFTHVIDRILLLIFKKRLFGIPVTLESGTDDFRNETFEIAYKKATKALNKDDINFTHSAYDTIMEYMMYIIMDKNQKLFSDVQRFQAMTYFRKHMVIALLPYVYVSILYRYIFLLVIIFILIITFFIGYRRLYIRTFFERIPLSYLQVTMDIE